MVIKKCSVKSGKSWKQLRMDIQNVTVDGLQMAGEKTLFRGEITEYAFHLKPCFTKNNLLSIKGMVTQDTSIGCQLKLDFELNATIFLLLFLFLYLCVFSLLIKKVVILLGAIGFGVFFLMVIYNMMEESRKALLRILEE